MITVEVPPTFEAWRERARACLYADVPPQGILWRSTAEAAGQGQQGLFAATALPAAPRQPLDVPKQFLQGARAVVCHRDASRYEVLYRLLWALTHGRPHVLDDAVDADTRAFGAYWTQVSRDVHKCHAFVRFRQVRSAGAAPHYVAWYRPNHRILRLAARHFVERFRSMRWTLLTADEAALWDGHKLRFGPGVPRAQAPTKDALEDLWRIYYASIFNPARLKIKAMRQEMPRRYWSTLPESRLIDGLIRGAAAQQRALIANQPRRAEVPPAATLEGLREAAAGCRLCPWCERSTQTVFGRGPADATWALVGEQPGDVEDMQGVPFVGPAGALLDRALAAAGIARQGVYVTNAVKHFKWAPRGKRRIHQRPAAQDIAACKPWLAAELRQIAPARLVCLGATAAQSVFGKVVRITELRGSVQPSAFCPRTLITHHPAAILRADASEQATMFDLLVADLQALAATA